MNRRNLPFSALRAFEAAARHASVSAAAKELSVTHSAVSHQIKRLEAELGITLFTRTNRGLILSPDGATLLPVLSESFDRVSATLESLRVETTPAALQITSTPTFAGKWLVPRLSNWYANPDAARIHLRPDLELLDFKTEKIDFAIRCGIPPWDGLQHQLLMPIHLVPVCSPGYARENQLNAEPTQLLKHKLIHADVGDHGLGDEWRDWFSGCQLKCPSELPGLSFRDPALAMQAAADGLGIAIGYRELIDFDLQTGKLVNASDILVKHPYSYYLVFNDSNQLTAAAQSFAQWIQTQISTQS